MNNCAAKKHVDTTSLLSVDCPNNLGSADGANLPWRVSTMTRKFMCLVFVLVCVYAQAQLLVYEPFNHRIGDEGAGDSDLSFGWEEGSGWFFYTNTIDESYPNASVLEMAGNIAFGRLVSTGMAVRVTTPTDSMCSLERPMSIPAPATGDSVWFSYLMNYSGPTNSATYKYHTFGITFRHNAASSYSYCAYPLYAGTWESGLCSAADSNGKDMAIRAWNEGPYSEKTYLVVCAITNIALPAWHSSDATEIRQWVLDETCFSNVCETGILDSKYAVEQSDFISLLDGSSLSVSYEKCYGGWGTPNLNTNDVWQITSLLSLYNNPTAIYVIDELRMGRTYKDVIPLVPLPPIDTLIMIK